MAVRIEITSDGPMALVRPVGWLGPDLFEVFRKAIAGATFDRKRKANLLSVELVPTVSRRLRTAGFDYDVDPKLLENLEIRTAQQWLEPQGVRERVDHTDRELRQRSEPPIARFVD